MINLHWQVTYNSMFLYPLEVAHQQHLSYAIPISSDYFDIQLSHPPIRPYYTVHEW